MQEETRVAVISMIVDSGENVDSDSTSMINSLLHECRSHIIGRMGIPYHRKNVNIISIAVDAPQDVINSISGKIGRLQGVSTKTVYTKS